MSFKNYTMPPLPISAVGTSVALTAGVAEKSTITTVADVAGSLDGTYFIIYDAAGSVGVWIDVGDSGTTAPAGALAADRQLEVTGVIANDTANDVAAAVRTTINADAAFSASVSSSTITVTDAAVGTRTDIAAGDTGFTVAVTVQGRAAQNDTPVMAVSVYSVDGNSGIIYVGDSNVSSSRYFSALDPEEQWEWGDSGSGAPKEIYLSDIYVDASSAGDIVQIAYTKRR